MYYLCCAVYVTRAGQGTEGGGAASALLTQGELPAAVSRPLTDQSQPEKEEKFRARKI